MTRTLVALTFAWCASACASAPPAPPPAPVGPTSEEKLSWILRLEDQRVLRDPAPALTPPPAPVGPLARGQTAPIVVPPPPPPDLLKLLTDGEARVRRGAALAVGRVGLREGIQPLVALLGDPDPEVRQMAAFALGLIGDTGARDSLVAALGDPSPIVKGSAAEALGLIGDPSAAVPIGQMAEAIVQSGSLAPPPGDEDDARIDTPAAAFRLAIYALVRLKAYAPLASAVLDANGQPRLRWWPVAYALQRIDDDRALPALMTLAKETHPYLRTFAVKGLGRPKNHAAVPVLLPLVSGSDRVLAIEAIRSLGRIGDPSASPPLLRLVQTLKSDPVVRVEAVSAIGSVGGDGIVDGLLDILGDPSPLVRAAALRSLAQLDREGFILTLSGIDQDPHWSVRAALASVLGTLPADVALPRLHAMLADSDQRVIPAVLASLTKLRSPDAASLLLDHLKADDPAVRAAAAAAIGELKPTGGAQALAEAYRAGQRDPEYTARAAALSALAQYGAATAPGVAVLAVLNDALSDRDWAVRVRAASLLKQLDPTSDAATRIRPAPSNAITSDLSEVLRLANPPVSTEVYIDTDRGTIQIELAVLDAPIAVENFIVLARKGFFNGLTFHRVVPDFVIQGGDPRGDSEGGPGYTIRDEVNERPYLRGTVGMALDWNDTAGSQFFITHSPQPQLDGRYTVFGRVVAGMDVVDQIQQWDVIRRVRVWDGAEGK